MPRRLNPSTVEEGEIFLDGGGAPAAADAAAAEEVPTSEVLLARAREYFDLNAQIKDLGAQVSVLRKSLKGVEKALLNGMLLNNMEEVDVDGLKIYRARKLLTKED